MSEPPDPAGGAVDGPAPDPIVGPAGRRELRADCGRCFALCCVAPAFAASADFAIDKRAGQPCPNLRTDSRCGIHSRLRDSGFAGCAGYDCFGAGQQVSQVTFGGRDWRRDPGTARRMFAVFPVLRQLNELRWHLTEALALPAARPLHGELRRALEDAERLAAGDPDAVLAVDAAARRQVVGALLRRASELVRADARPRRRDLGGADLVGASLRGADLRAADLRGAYLLGADLRDADLRLADLLGADLRGADLRGADLTGSLFLVRSQLDAARGDARTGVPAALGAPTHWES